MKIQLGLFETVFYYSSDLFFANFPLEFLLKWLYTALIVKKITFKIQTCCLSDDFSILTMSVKYAKVLENTCNPVDDNIILIFKGLKISQSFFCCTKELYLIDSESMRMFLKKCSDQKLRLSETDNTMRSFLLPSSVDFLSEILESFGFFCCLIPLFGEKCVNILKGRFSCVFRCLI